MESKTRAIVGTIGQERETDSFLIAILRFPNRDSGPSHPYFSVTLARDMTESGYFSGVGAVSPRKLYRKGLFYRVKN